LINIGIHFVVVVVVVVRKITGFLCILDIGFIVVDDDFEEQEAKCGAWWL
jgi:hypothetical protein